MLQTHAIDIDAQRPLAALLPFLPDACLLESALKRPRDGEWSFLGLPSSTLTVDSRGIGDLFTRLRQSVEHLLGQATASDWRAQREQHGLPFAGGLMGWLAYDLAPDFERVRNATPACAQTPGTLWFVVPHVLCRHEPTGKHLVTGTKEGFSDALRRLQVAAALAASESASDNPPQPAHRVDARDRATTSLERAHYLKAVESAIAYIRAGDIFEVNLTQQILATSKLPPHALYHNLRAAAPAPFAAYLTHGSLAIVSASPERLVALRNRRMEARPIKGTRRRGATPTDDARLRAELISSAKDLAELAMVIDLERNDLGRVATLGSVRVVEEAALYTLPTVHHLEGWVEADLAPGLDALDMVRATFPGGSISGAPKPRAMEIIAELEPVPRGLYTGSVGYLDASGDLDLNIAIRTIICHDSTVRFGIGGAITAESDPELEYEESLTKGVALARALGFDLRAALSAPSAPTG